VNSTLKLGNAVAVLYKKNDSSIDLLKAHPPTKEIIESKYGLHKYDFEELKSLPSNSLGCLFAKELHTHDLNPLFYEKHTISDFETDHQYIIYRLRKTHDLWHIATGFDTSDAGEAGLMAVYYAQLRTPFSRLIICLSFVHFIFRFPTKIPELLDAITRGWSIGKKAKPLIGVKWEELMHKPLAQVQTELNIT